MKKIRDFNTKEYQWNFKGVGLFEVTLKDGVLTDLRFCGRGSSLEAALLSTDIKFLKAVHKALSELFPLLEEKV